MIPFLSHRRAWNSLGRTYAPGPGVSNRPSRIGRSGAIVNAFPRAHLNSAEDDACGFGDRPPPRSAEPARPMPPPIAADEEKEDGGPLLRPPPAPPPAMERLCARNRCSRRRSGIAPMTSTRWAMRRVAFLASCAAPMAAADIEAKEEESMTKGCWCWYRPLAIDETVRAGLRRPLLLKLPPPPPNSSKTVTSGAAPPPLPIPTAWRS